MKKYLSAVLACIMCFSLYSCDKESDANSKNNVNESATVSQSAETEVTNITENVDNSLAEIIQSAQENDSISPDRFNDNNTELFEVTKKLLDTYYKGVSEENFDLCFSSYAYFYSEAMKIENKYYDITEKEYMSEYNAELKNTYGDDYYAYVVIIGALQLYDEGLAQMEKNIEKAFDIKLELEDAYEMYYEEYIRGNLNSTTNQGAIYLLKIDGEYVLYNDFYETIDLNSLKK